MQWLHRGPRQVGQPAGNLGSEGISSDSVEIGRCECQAEGSTLHDSQSDGLAESAVEGVKDAVRTNLACLVRRFGQEFPGGHPSPGLACEILRGDGEQVQ